MGSANISIDHAESGLVTAQVLAARQISPHFVRVTLGGSELQNWRHLGFDQWFRLAVPTSSQVRFDNLPDRFGMGGYLKYLTTAKATRPAIRNYTVRAYRADPHELDIDFVVHGEEGIAGPWARRLPVGETVGLIDQGCGYRDLRAETTLLVGDETALPAIAGILRDLDRGATGTAIIELPHAEDVQDVDAPVGMDVRWLVRDANDRPGERALNELSSFRKLHTDVNAFIAGESKLATGGRRHLVQTLEVPKERVTFVGYWRLKA